MSQFPNRRMRRLRRTPALRRLVQETHLVPSQLVWPLFACHGEGVRREVAALPGVFQTSVDELVRDAERARRLGLGGIILFGLPAAKDATGSEAYDEQGIVQQAARAVKRATPDLLVIGDACLCEYTDHGHCGVVQDGDVDNDASVYLLGKVAVTQARAGIDIVAPSDMMDGRVAGIRKALDAAGFSRLPIMSYAAKMASAFYGPFREAAGQWRRRRGFAGRGGAGGGRRGTRSGGGGPQSPSAPPPRPSGNHYRGPPARASASIGTSQPPRGFDPAESEGVGEHDVRRR